MTDIVKVTEEEFDIEGNLTKRTITEYATQAYKIPPWPSKDTPNYEGVPKYTYPLIPTDTWPPNVTCTYTVPNPTKYKSWNRV